jgi:tetratricopeptide (TPR) repeat protein
LTLNLQAAKRAYERAIAIDPKSLVAHVGLGKVEYSLAHYKDADRVLNQALALSPSDPQALLTLARLRLEQASSDSDFRAVQDLLERAAKADPTNADVWYDLGRVALQRKRTADAIQHLTKALQIYPGHNAAMHQLELAFRRAGRTADAERLAAVFQERVMREREETHLEEVVAHSPDDWDAQARLTEIYLKSGKRGLALLTYKRLTAGKPNHPALPKLLPQLNQELSGSQSAPSEPKGP